MPDIYTPCEKSTAGEATAHVRHRFHPMRDGSGDSAVRGPFKFHSIEPTRVGVALCALALIPSNQHAP